MGSSMVGNPTCARTEPSTNSTNACTTDWGCTTTSTASYGSPNRKCASITSSALLTRVAESTVIFFPIFHVGWRSASSTVAPATRSGVQVRNGPPDAAPRPPSPVPRPVYDTDVGRVEFACLLLEQFGVRMGGERRDAEPLALAPEHLEGRAPDRAGRAQDRDAQAHATPNRRNRPAV